MRKRGLWGLFILLLAGLAAGFFWLRQRQADQAVPEILRTGDVILGDLELSTSASGTVSMRRTTRVVATTTGKVERVLVSAQERVTQGQVLAAMDSADLLRAVQQAENAVEQTEIALAAAERPADDDQIRLAELALRSAAEALELARIGTETARVDANALIVQAQRQREQAYIRLRDATDGDAKSQAQTAFEQAEIQERIAQLNADLTRESADAQYLAARISYTQAQDSLEALRKPVDEDTVRQRALDVEKAQLRLQQAERALEDSKITAPHAGVVAADEIEAGTIQRAGDTAFTIIDDSEIYVDTTIDEIDIGTVEVGLRATLTPDAYPGATLLGTVESIAPVSVNIGGLVAYRVRITLTGTEGLRLLDGMAVGAQIIIETLEDRVLVPAWAVRRDETTSEAYCWRVEGGTVERTTVQLGSSNELSAEIVDGLEIGDEVALVAEERSLFDMAPQGGPPWLNE